MSIPPDNQTNGLRWTVENHERRLLKIESLELTRELGVIARRLDDIDQDIRDLRAQLQTQGKDVRERLTWQSRALIGAMLTVLGGLAIVLLTIPHG